MKKSFIVALVALLLTVVIVLVITKSPAPKKPENVFLKATYPSGKLEGKMLGDLYAKYLGTNPDRKIGKTITTDFEKNLEKMWRKKIQISGNIVVNSTGKKVLDDYDISNSRKMTYSQYCEYIDSVVILLKNHTNWKMVAKVTNLTVRKAKLAEHICKSFNGKDIVAYEMTELMPSSNAKINISVMEFLLQNAGKEYIESIPALSDAKTSFGPFQFTEYALYSHKGKCRGASVINQAVASFEKIPNSVMMLEGDDHYKAAYMFAVYNTCTLIRNLNEQQLSMLEKYKKTKKKDLVIYCATAHHLPTKAMRHCKSWLDKLAKINKRKTAEFNKNLAVKNIMIDNSCTSTLALYAKKTRNNLEE